MAADTQSRASGSSFYLAMRLMPRREREAMFAIYAFCRAVDDIADDEGPPPDERRMALDGWRADLDALFAGAAPERAAFLAGPVADFDLTKGDFFDVILGMEMDIEETIRGPEFTKLDLYCDRVASAVGRLSTHVFGMEQGPGRELAHHLGRALQFTNILRDLDEDAAIGRLYLPAEALAAAGIKTTQPLEVIYNPAIDAACRWLAARAEAHYRDADRVMAARPAGRLRTPRLMSAVYAAILARMEEAGWAAPRPRIKPGKISLLWMVARHGLVG
ncbi:MAG TPA: presqualene diphosphate synthase HpnD [Caulobacteraceae bacterium]|nr:presqualene diphosphate synthase HpnD [Caulobacteraceae bacterium]